jgi:hypothetical protein
MQRRTRIREASTIGAPRFGKFTRSPGSQFSLEHYCADEQRSRQTAADRLVDRWGGGRLHRVAWHNHCALYADESRSTAASQGEEEVRFNLIHAQAPRRD